MNFYKGYRFKTRNGGSCEVIKYVSHSEVYVKHLDDFGYISKVRTDRIKSGSIKNPYSRDVFGVGYLGVGDFKSVFKGGQSLEYRAWNNMLQRCYDKNYSRKNLPSYLNCTVHPDWHNFQNFAEWYTNQENYGRGYHLDKDILKTGNTEYSSKNCCIVPNEINCLYKVMKDSTSVGVRGTKDGKYRVYLSTNGGSKYLGTFNSIDEAEECYVKNKRFYVREVVERNRHKISEKVYLRLLDDNSP